MKILTLSLIALTLSACGTAKYGSKEECDAAFSTMQSKMSGFVEKQTTLTAVKAAIGEPEVIYSTNNPSTEDYAYRVYADNYCGQYRLQITDKTTLNKIETFKDYLVK